MVNSPVIQNDARTALAARDILSRGYRAASTALLLLLAVGALVGGPPVFAQDTLAAAPAATPVAASVAAPAAASGASQVNINTADVHALAAGLKGVGESRAAEIVRHRETYGPFASVDELMEVNGIGKSTLDNNRDVITLE